jgi:hypothetical protein
LTWQNDFDFIPDVPSTLDTLKTDITFDATTIKNAALDALKKAYSPWRVTIFEGLTGGDHSALIQTTTSGQGSSCGFTNLDISPPTTSVVAYECNMKEAQEALQVVIRNAQDEKAALNNLKLIQAIGRGIGSTAAHEIAHQFLAKCCSMDVLISDDVNAAGTYNNGDADGDPSPQVVDSDPSPYTGYWKDGTTPIKWESTTKAALTKCLGSGWKDYGLTTCSVKLELSLNYFEFRSPGDAFSTASIPDHALDIFLGHTRRGRRLTLKPVFVLGGRHRDEAIQEI